MTLADRQRWDAKYADRVIPAEIEPPEWLVRHTSERTPGRALDLACGVGHTAIWLAQRGWNVTAVDISPVGLEAARQLTLAKNVSVEWIAADLDGCPLGESEYDLITVFRFLDRATLPARIETALRPGGWLIYETFLAAEPSSAQHVKNPAFVLQPGELPRLYAGLTVLHYEERADNPDPVARMVAAKPSPS